MRRKEERKEEKHRKGERRKEWIGGGVSVPSCIGIWGIFGNQDSPWGEEEGRKSWRDRVPQREEELRERGPGTGKGSRRGLPGMGGAARLSTLRALVLWAALGTAGKAWGSGQEPLREGRG